MKKFILLGFAVLCMLSLASVYAHAKPGGEKPADKGVTDNDRDGYHEKRDCNDADPLVYPGAVEICGDGVDQNCDGTDEACRTVCTDSDSDGFSLEGGECGPVDCNDANSFINPDAVEICGDGVDQNCDGVDTSCTGSGPHAGLTYENYPANCLSCHYSEATEFHASTHYQWTGEATDMVNNPAIPQGKLTNAVNSYCINIEGNWPVCGSCHTGRGKRPDDETAGLENIDCLVCHNEEYAAARKRLADGSLGVESPSDSMVRNIQPPTRTNCLLCHAKAGGGDAVKRGDLSLQTIVNSDPYFDVHMDTSGSNLSCQQCHVFEAHKVIGKGSDLRPTDDPVRGAEVACTTCHAGKDSPGGHSNNDIGRHVTRVACQTCHIPEYAKVPTETHRDWRFHHDGSPADGVSGPGHPYTIREGNLTPEYRFWNRLSDNSLLGDDASLTYDELSNTYPTSRPLGDNRDGKLYPFKYKTATQPKTLADDRLIALDTFEYLKGSGNADLAVRKGLTNMGYAESESYEWIDTDTYQLINHGVSPASDALQCSECHENQARMDLQGELGYELKGDQATLCTQCHNPKEAKPFATLHNKHVTDKGYDCSWCHTFSRPERNLRMP